MKVYEALSNYVVLRPLKAEVAIGSILLPDKSKNQYGDDAEVVSVGPEVSPDLSVGDIVVRPDPARIELTDDATGDVLLICSEEDIMARVKGNETDSHRRRFLMTAPGVVQEVSRG